MGVYIYAIKIPTVKTNLGIEFHPSKYSHKPSVFGSFFTAITDWEKSIQKKENLREAREERKAQILQDSPEKWKGIVGYAIEGYDNKDESKTPVGVVVNLYRSGPRTSWADTGDPGTYMGRIKKVGRGKWKWLERLASV